MESFGSIECFVRSAEGGSFAEAARHLSLTLTEAGKLFLEEVSGSLITIQNAVANLASAEGRPVGTLKVSMGTVFGNRYVVPLLVEFMRRFPDISPDWHFDNRQVDLIGQGFDAAIGGGFELPQGVVARKLTPAHRVLVASADYLAQRLPVLAPEDLARCLGILIRSPQTGRVRSWQLTNREREQRPLELKPRMTLSDSEAACCASAQGLGIALVSMPMAVPFLDSGAVVRVLPDWYVDDGNISLYYAEHKLLPGKTRAFVDFIIEQFVMKGLAQRFSAI